MSDVLAVLDEARQEEEKKCTDMADGKARGQCRKDLATRTEGAKKARRVKENSL